METTEGLECTFESLGVVSMGVDCPEAVADIAWMLLSITRGEAEARMAA